MIKNQPQQQQDFDFDADDDLDKLRELPKVGVKTIDRLEACDQYDTIQDVRDSTISDIDEVIQLNYSDAVWIVTRLREYDYDISDYYDS